MWRERWPSQENGINEPGYPEHARAESVLSMCRSQLRNLETVKRPVVVDVDLVRGLADSGAVFVPMG